MTAHVQPETLRSAFTMSLYHQCIIYTTAMAYKFHNRRLGEAVQSVVPTHEDESELASGTAADVASRPDDKVSLPS